MAKTIRGLLTSSFAERKKERKKESKANDRPLSKGADSNAGGGFDEQRA